MRSKQTARKSTTGVSEDTARRLRQLQSSQPRRTNATDDDDDDDDNEEEAEVETNPVKIHIKKLLETKRRSLSNSYKKQAEQQSARSSQSSFVYNPARALPEPSGKKIYNYQGVKVRPYGHTTLKDIKRLQHTYELLIPRAPFHRLVRQVTQELRTLDTDPVEIRYQTAALEALQEAAEHYLIRLFEDSYLCCLHAKRVTLFIQDMRLCRRLQQHPVIH